MRMETPDLWNRIQDNLQEHPERSQRQHYKDAPHPLRRFPYAHTIRGMAAAAAAVIAFAVLIPWHVFNPILHSEITNDSGGLEDAADAQPEAAAETRDTFSETLVQSETAFLTHADSAALSYSQLALTPYDPLPVPDRARTVPEDAMYFSESILGDTELLCQATITDVRLITDQDGTATNISYDVTLDQVYYSQDYVTEKDHMVVNAPIIQASSDSGAAGHVLYQMQTSSSYLLPLKKQGGSWELLCASAPQVQITGDGAYLFHSGYTTLADSRSRIVIGNQEGANDYYYDRMLLRDDDDFLSDFIMLTRR